MASSPAPDRHGGRGESAHKRRRRTPEEARSEILAAAREVLAERGAQGLNVADVMKRTTLSRKAFYVHFEGRTELLLALLLPLRAGADNALAAWTDGDDLKADGRAALDHAAQMYREHGPALRAVFWSSGEDPEIVAVRRTLVEPILAASRLAVRRSTRPLPDPELTAELLATMNVHTLLERAPGSSDAELHHLTEALSEIWERTLGLAAP